MKARISEAVKFLQRLRPQGPWVLTAIVPDGATTTITARNENDVAAFITRYDGKRNLYYSVNPTRTEMNKKAKKTDIAAVEYALADLDPADGETSEAAKTRYLKQLNGGSFRPAPTTALDCGNGMQCLWRLKEQIVLGKPVNGKFAPEDKAKIDDVEARVKAVMMRLGSQAGNAEHRPHPAPAGHHQPAERGEEARPGGCRARPRLLWFNGYQPSAVGVPEAGGMRSKPRPVRRSRPLATRRRLLHAGRIQRGRPGTGYPRQRGQGRALGTGLVRLLTRCCDAATSPRQSSQVLLDRDNGISEHVYDQAKPREYAERQVAQAMAEIEFICNKTGKIRSPTSAQHPHRAAQAGRDGALRSVCRSHPDRWAAGLRPGAGGCRGQSDLAVVRPAVPLQARRMNCMRIVVNDTARLNGFHPVRDYLDGLRWDGMPRIDRWLVDLRRCRGHRLHAGGGRADADRRGAAGAPAGLQVRRDAGAGTAAAGHRQVIGTRRPGGARRLVFRRPAAQCRRQARDRELRGRWIVEAAELSGMRKADVEHLKAFLSRRIDRARMAYGRLPIEAPRQCIVIGTTNKSRISARHHRQSALLAGAGQGFDLAALRRDRDQLWAEAAAREANGESIRLAPELWPQARNEQKQRPRRRSVRCRTRRPSRRPRRQNSRCDVWTILDLRGAQLTQEVFMRSSEAMKRIGWKRPNKSGMLRFGGKPVSAFAHGNSRWAIKVSRDQYRLYVESEEAIEARKEARKKERRA